MTATDSPSTTTGLPGGWALLRRTVRRHWPRLILFCLLLISWQLAEAMVPVVVGVVIDRAVASGGPEAMLWWGGALALVFLVLSYSYRFGARVGFGVMQREQHDLRVEIADHALHPRGARTTSLTGEVLSLATSDTESVGIGIRALGHAFASSASVILCAVILLRTDLVIGLVVLVGVPLTLGAIQLLAPVISRRSAAQQASVARASGMATDFIRGLRILKGIGAEQVASDRYARRSQEARGASIRTTTSYGGMQGITVGSSGIFLALVTLVAAKRALDGEITIGELVAVVGLTQFIAEPLGAFGHIGAQLAMAHASAGRIADFLRTPVLLHSGDAPLHEAVPELAFDEVSHDAVQDFSTVVSPGELVVLAVDDPGMVGEVVRLLTGEIVPRSGAVRLGDSPLADHDVEVRRRVLLVNPHHTDLFAGTLRDNVDLLGALPADVVERVLHASAVDDVADLHPDGFDQPVSAQGRTFSGGQQQRIALARALAADAPILVLHDPTSAVDAVTEQRIAEGIRTLRHSSGSRRATLIITTSPAHLAQADRVIRL